MHDFKKLLQQKDELKELWSYLEIKTQFPEKEVKRWLLDHGKDQVQAAIELLAKREHDVADTVKYVGKVLHNSKLQNMTVEERQEKISALASLAGKVRAAREHEAKIAAIRQEFAEATLNSAEVRSVPLESALGVGVGLGIGVGGDFGYDAGNGSKPAAAAPPVVVPPSQSKTKAIPKPETKTEPRRCKQCGIVLTRDVNHVCQADPANQTPEKPKPDGALMPGDWRRYMEIIIATEDM